MTPSRYAGPGGAAGASCQPPRHLRAATSPGGTRSRPARNLLTWGRVSHPRAGECGTEVLPQRLVVEAEARDHYEAARGVGRVGQVEVSPLPVPHLPARIPGFARIAATVRSVHAAPVRCGFRSGSAAHGHGTPASFRARVIRAALCPASRCANIHVTTGAVAGSGSSLCARRPHAACALDSAARRAGDPARRSARGERRTRGQNAVKVRESARRGQ